MKNKKLETKAVILFFALMGMINCCDLSAQGPWVTNLNTPGPPSFRHDFGTTNAIPIDVYTNGSRRAQFTTGGILTNPAGLNGDGMRIFDPFPGGQGNLDLWTGASNTTHIKWDGSGNIDGQNNRFEVIGHYTGLWLDATPGTLFPGLVPPVERSL